MTRLTCLFLFYLMMTSFLSGQRLMVSNIEERRTTTGEWDYMNVICRLIGDDARKYDFYKIGEITEASDNVGIKLLAESAYSNEYVPISETITIGLMKAARSATSISISGTIALYKPTEANGGIAKISGFVSKPNTNLAPKGSLYGLTYIDANSLKKMAEVSEEDRYNKYDKLPEAERRAQYDLEYFIQSVAYYSEQEIDNSLFFILSGDISNIVKLEFENSKGKKFSPTMSSKTEYSHQYVFEEKPDKDWRLVLTLENNKAVKTIPFTLKGVDLP